ncbi:MAG: carbamoyl phosphate synthase small subunit, partial [Candidatus Omnitrophota bacterium]|nr:carbamoyl phosphate synthase small subunit [Candidatus Omnitrophota bacterium]
PLIGNYGVADKFYESSRCWIAGLVIKENSRIYSNWQAQGSFDQFLKKEGVSAISGVDTRTLAVYIRDKGEMFGIIAPADSGPKEELLKKIKAYKKEKKPGFIRETSVIRPTVISRAASGGASIGVLDLGILNSFLRQLTALGCGITLLPYTVSAEEALAMKFDGMVISNGPEDDAAMPEIVKTAKDLLGKIPILGISTGHEIIGLALGARLKKMKIGHHGVNYPVKAPDSYKGEITVQNHSFIIDDQSLKGKKSVSVTMRNINDNSIEEMRSAPLKFISTQYYPSSPGFDETNEIFMRFLKMIPRKKILKRKNRSRADNEVQYAKT